jgi:hypothetical protein
VRVALPEQITPGFRAKSALSPGDTYGTARVGDRGQPPETEQPDAALSHSSAPPDPRIERYCQQIGEHWVWRLQSGLNSEGYPRLKVGGKYVYVHLLWWEAVNGPVPIGPDGKKLTVDHTCEYGKLCVSPWCKQLLSRPQNTALRWERARGFRFW